MLWPADIGQLDELGVGIVRIARVERMVHDLADPQALGHRPDGKDRLIQALQVVPESTRALTHGALGERDRPGVPDGRRRQYRHRGAGGAPVVADSSREIRRSELVVDSLRPWMARILAPGPKADPVTSGYGDRPSRFTAVRVRIVRAGHGVPRQGRP